MKTRRNALLTLFMGGIFTLGLMTEIPVAKADPPPWAPAHGWRAKHTKRYYYYYYPSQQVYYSPVKNGYYYLNGSNWVYGPSVPASIQLGNKVRIELGTPTPYTQHTYVIQQYPGVIVR